MVGNWARMNKYRLGMFSVDEIQDDSFKVVSRLWLCNKESI